MKYILGILIGVGVSLGGYAVATGNPAISGLIKVDSKAGPGTSSVTKLYDADTNIVCYTLTYSYGNLGAISCVDRNH